MLGILVIDKPLGITSHDVVGSVRRSLETKRVGHAGTLDPLATGVLVVAVGPATRFLQYLPLEPKVYEASVHFGQATDTQDAEGEVIFEGKLPPDLESSIHDFLPNFLGEVNQVPPMFSAVKKNGKPLYEYAREGEELDRDPRTIFVEKFEFLGLDGTVGQFRITCSGGTYIRTLANDLGDAIGCGAFLSGLRRTEVGKFTLKQTIGLQDVSLDKLIPLKEALPPVPMVSLSPLQVARIREGQSLRLPDLPIAKIVALLDERGVVFAAGRIEEDRIRPECVIPFEALYEPI